MQDSSGRERVQARRIIPLVSTAFTPGKCREAIEAIEDPEERAVAWAGYFHLIGDAEEAVARIRPFLEHEDPALRISAHIQYFISNMAMGDAKGAMRLLRTLKGALTLEKAASATDAYYANFLKKLLFLWNKEFTIEEDALEAIPEGAKLFACYFLAMREYLLGEYESAIGIAKAALLLGGNRYPITAIYLHSIFAAALVRIKRFQEAERHFQLAWETAAPDGFFAPFGQQYVMLAGLNKKNLKAKNPEEYRTISRYANTFIQTWIEMRDSPMEQHVKQGLTKTEYIAAMLFRRGLSMKEIASCMGVSVNTVKRHISIAYQKTNTKKRDQLPKTIIR